MLWMLDKHIKAFSFCINKWFIIGCYAYYFSIFM